LTFDVKDVLDAAVLGPFLDELAERTPGAPKGAIERARAGQFKEAEAELKAAGAAAGAAEPFVRGLALLSAGQVQKASDAFREAIRVSPDFLIGAFYIGACYAAGGRTTQAINAWQTSLIGLDRFPAVYRLLGEALIQAGEAERALALLTRGAERWPGDRALGGRALQAALDAGRFDRAMVQLDRLLDQETVDPELLFRGMQAVFEAALEVPTEAPAEAGAQDPRQLLERITRLRDRYVAAGGTRVALAAEWIAFIEATIYR